MDENERSNQLAASYPAPPPFHKYFTSENLERFKTFREKTEQHDQDADHTQILNNTRDEATQRHVTDISNLAPELLYLIPPEPPTNGIYRSFGEIIDLSNSLQSPRTRAIEQLYTNPPSSSGNWDKTSTSNNFSRVDELIKLSRSILLSFLELTGILSENPSLAPAKLEDLRILFLNTHHLVNQYRPHQARETLIDMVAEQVRKRREEIQGVKTMQVKVDKILADLEKNDDVVSNDSRVSTSKDLDTIVAYDSQRRDVWAALDEIEVDV